MRLITMCLRNLSYRKLRTGLCILGVATAVCFIIAVGATTTRYAAIMIEMNVFFREEVVVVSRDVIAIQGFPIGGVIPQSIVDDIAEIDGVEKVTPMLFALEFRLGEASNTLPINVTIGLPVQEWATIIDPSFLRPGGALPQENSTDIVIIGHSLADQYGLSTGSRMVVESQELTVGGVIEEPFALLGRSIIMDLETAQRILKYPMQINMVIVKPESGFSEEQVASAVESRVSYVMALTEDERSSLTSPIVAIITNWNVAIEGVTLFLSMILVTVFGIINVSERRRDFATLHAIGAPLSCTCRIVLFEAALIGIFGGILGIVFGSVVAVVLATLYTSVPFVQFFSGIFLIVPPLYMIKIFAFVVVVCCVGGIVPAVNATRMRIAEVLRAEY